MSEPNLISQYELNMSTISVLIGFTDDHQIYTKMGFVKKTVPLSSLSSVTIKKAPLQSKLQYEIKMLKPNGKEQFFQTIHIDPADAYGISFIEELKLRLPDTCKWVEKLGKIQVKEDIDGKKKYNLQILWFMKAKLFAGKGRVLQIIMNYGMLTFITAGFSLPLLIYVIVGGCHRVTTDLHGIKIKKLFSAFFVWEDVTKIEVTKYNIIITNFGATADRIFLMKFHLTSRNGKKIKFIIRSLEGKQFIQDMIGRKKMDSVYEGMFL